jgi:hypothetical protein
MWATSCRASRALQGGGGQPLTFNWWNLFVRLADPAHHREAITSRPLVLQAIGRQTSHAGRTTVIITSRHGEHARARAALTRIAGFFAHLRKTAEQLTADLLPGAH